MGMMVGVDGEGGGPQRLRRYLPTEQPSVVPVGRAATPEQVAVEPLEVEQPEQALDRRWQVLDIAHAFGAVGRHRRREVAVNGRRSWSGSLRRWRCIQSPS